jgi:IgGFc binding protein
VVSVPPEQYLSDYVFFADPTYPETNLVLIRERGLDAQFHDVTLDCAGVLANWQTVGDYEWTRADLMTGNFAPVGNCSTGRHQVKSDAPFGLWVWGWGTPLTSTFTANVSYGYPGGMNVAPINMVVIE